MQCLRSPRLLLSAVTDSLQQLRPAAISQMRHPHVPRKVPGWRLSSGGSECAKLTMPSNTARMCAVARVLTWREATAGEWQIPSSQGL